MKSNIHTAVPFRREHNDGADAEIGVGFGKEPYVGSKDVDVSHPRQLFDGFIKLMIPVPSSRHQEILFNLTGIFRNFILNKKCKGFAAPSDVRFPKDRKSLDDKQVYTVLQPDLYIVCDLSKIDDRGCVGAPDMIIEIISQKNSKRDTHDKFEIYSEYGVREYWIVNPTDENVNVFVLDKKEKFQLAGMYAEDDKIPVNIFNGDLKADLREVFTS